MDRSKAVARARQFADRVKAAMDVRQVVLFGSYGQATAGEPSDIDAAVFPDSPAESWLDTSVQLYRLRRDIDLGIEPVRIDWTEDRSGFLEEIRRTREIIYDRDAEQAAA